MNSNSSSENSPKLDDSSPEESGIKNGIWLEELATAGQSDSSQKDETNDNIESVDTDELSVVNAETDRCVQLEDFEKSLDEELHKKKINFIASNLTIEDRMKVLNEMLPPVSNDATRRSFKHEKIEILQNIKVEIDENELFEKNSEDRKLIVKYTCDLCSKSFDFEQQYYGHLQTHGGERTWTCEKCVPPKKTFNNQSELQKHERMFHLCPRPYPCTEDGCDRTFDRASQRDCHIRRVHRKERNFHCEMCDRKFFRRSDLKNHLNVHLNTNSNVCDICGKGFSHISNLLRHKDTHSDQKPYACQVCSQRFKQISGLRKHVRSRPVCKEAVIPSARKFYCKKCGKTFPHTDQLHHHESTSCEGNPGSFKSEEQSNSSTAAQVDVKIVDDSKSTRSTVTEQLVENARVNNWSDVMKVLMADLEIDSSDPSKVPLKNVQLAESTIKDDSDGLQYSILKNVSTEDAEKDVRDNLNENVIDNQNNVLTIGANDSLISFDVNNTETVQPTLNIQRNNMVPMNNLQTIIFIKADNNGFVLPSQSETSYETNMKDIFDNAQSLVQNKNQEQLESNISFLNCDNLITSTNLNNQNVTTPIVYYLQNVNNLDESSTVLNTAGSQISLQQPIASGEVVNSNSQVTVSEEDSNKVNVPTVENSSTKRAWSCPHCTKSFSRYMNYKQHLGTHNSEDKQYACKHCDKRFAWRSTFSKHVEVAHGKKQTDTSFPSSSQSQFKTEFLSQSSEVMSESSDLQSDLLSQSSELLSQSPQLQSELLSQSSQLQSELLSQSSQLQTEFLSQSPQLQSELLSQSPQLQTELLSRSPQLQSELLSQSSHLQSEFLSQSPQLQTDLLSQSPQLQTDLLSQSPQLQTDLLSQSPQLQTDLLSQSPQLQSELLSQSSQLHTELLPQTSEFQTELLSHSSQLQTDILSQSPQLQADLLSQSPQLLQQPSQLQTELVQHFQTQPQTEELQFTCTICDRKYVSIKKLREHTRRVHKTKLELVQAQAQTSTFTELQPRIQPQSQPRIQAPQLPQDTAENVCTDCSKQYASRARLSEHIKRVHTEKLNKCDFEGCDKAFYKPYDLRLHMRIHTNTRPFVCEVCQKAFRSKAHLSKHEKVHKKV